MAEWPKDQLRGELMSIARMINKELDQSEPLDHLAEHCAVFIHLVPAALLGEAPTEEDRTKAAKLLLRVTAFKSDQDWVRAAGDLLGLTNSAPGSMEDMPKE